MEGSDTIVDGKIRRSKMGFSDKKPYRPNESGNQEILASSFPILRFDLKTVELTRLFLFSDGKVKIGTDGASFPLEQLRGKYDSREISNSTPAGSSVIVPGLGRFETTHEFGSVSVDDRILQLEDRLSEMNGQKSVVTRCREAFREYEQGPSREKRESLRAVYERVPTHLRCYCGDMDTKDSAIRRVLYVE